MDLDQADMETFSDRRERLASSPRQRELDALITALRSSEANTERVLEATRLLVVGAILEDDAEALRLAAQALHKAYLSWNTEHGTEKAEHRGEVRGLHNVASVVLERLLDPALLAELESGSVAHQMLSQMADKRGLSNDDLAGLLLVNKTQVSRAGARLQASGLATARRAGRRNAWDITPRGEEALNAVAAGGKPRPRRKQFASA